MHNKTSQERKFLALFPTYCGVGYAVARDADSFSAWGLRKAVGDDANKIAIRKFVRLLNRHKPTDIILEDIPKDAEHKRSRVAALIISMSQIAMSQGCTVYFYTRAQIRDAFHMHGAFTKHEIAEVIGTIMPELTHAIPPKRRVWETDPPAMSFFCAASLALTHFHFEQTPTG